MTVKSNCELDVRIKSTDDIQTCLRYNEEFVGCKGYFFDDLVKVTDLSKSVYGILLKVDNTDHVTDLCFKAELKNGNRSFFRFFIPEKLLNPVKKKYRPYTLAEWIEHHEIGEVIHYRSKSKEMELRYMYTGTRLSQGIKNIIEKITLGGESHTLDYLFENYEIEINGEWLPFGVLDNGEKE